jgi:hypothetical protein
VILYEVNLVVREAIHADYLAWLVPHMGEMLAFPGFVSAELLEPRDPPAPEGMRALTVHYRIVNEESLARYFAEDAPRMREEGLRRFGDGFHATRRVLAIETPR